MHLIPSISRESMLFSIFACCICLGSMAEVTPTLDDLLDGYKAHNAIIQDVSVSYDVRWVRYDQPGQPESVESRHWAKKADKEILTLPYGASENGAPSGLMLCIYDGVKTKVFARAFTEPRFKKGKVTEGKSNVFRELNPMYFLGGYLCQKSFEDLAGNPGAVLVRTEEPDYSDCVILQSPIGSDLVVKVYCSTTKGFMPIRIDGFWNGKINQSFHSIELTKFATSLGDVWLPTYGIWSSYPRSTGILAHDQIFQARSIQINSNLRNSLFDLNFPKDTIVEDSILETRHAVK